MKSPLCWYGGKALFLKKLMPLIPEHSCYAELFGGGGAFMLAKPPSKIEIYNDTNLMLVSFFRVIREKEIHPERYERFIHYVDYMPYSRVDFEDCRLTWDEEPDPELKIAKWFYSVRLSFGALEGGTTFSWAPTKNPAQSRNNHVGRFRELAQRLQHVQIECRDWEIIFDKIDREYCFIYLDPPYMPVTRVKSAREIYKHEMTEVDHEHLIDRLKRCKANVLLSGYASDLYDTLLEDEKWSKAEFEVETRMNTHQPQNDGKRGRTEVLWYNYPNPTQGTMALPGMEDF